MKFNIYGFNQQKLVEQYSNLNGNDLIVLRVLVDLIPRMTRSIEVHGSIFKQVTYELLLQDVPFVTKSESTLKKIVKKLIDAGLIEREIVNDNGKYTYFRVTKDLIALEYVAEKKEPKVVESEQRIDTDLADRIEYIEQVLVTRANKEIIRELQRFRNQREFFVYFDNYILPDRQLDKRNTCKYMLNSLKLYFSGALE